MEMDAEIEKQREANQAAVRENNKLRGYISDQQLEIEQLQKQIRKLERKIDVLEDADHKRTQSAPEIGSTIKKGFFKPMPRDYQYLSVHRNSSTKPRVDPVEKARSTGQGIVIDSATGLEANPQELWGEMEEEKNILLRKRSSLTIEEQLMFEMRNPPDVNAEFDVAKYSNLLGIGKKDEAEEMIKKEGGPTIAQMQNGALAVLRSGQSLDPNWCDKDYHDSSLAQWACSMGYEEVLKELLIRKADPSHRNQAGVSCLAIACSQSHLPCARYLLDCKADPNEVIDSEGGQTIMMRESRIEYSREDGGTCTNPFVLQLLGHRAELNVTDHKGKTALIHACTEGNAEVAEVLIEARADADVQDKDGRTALQIALQYYHGKISAMLVRHRSKLVPGVAAQDSSNK